VNCLDFSDVLPSLMLSRDQISIWSILKHSIGKVGGVGGRMTNLTTQDLTRITMPIVFNEPLSFLQRLAEHMEYVHLIKVRVRAVAVTHPYMLSALSTLPTLFYACHSSLHLVCRRWRRIVVASPNRSILCSARHTSWTDVTILAFTMSPSKCLIIRQSAHSMLAAKDGRIRVRARRVLVYLRSVQAVVIHV
jgi:hypothetical protein